MTIDETTFEIGRRVYVVRTGVGRFMFGSGDRFDAVDGLMSLVKWLHPSDLRVIDVDDDVITLELKQ